MSFLAEVDDDADGGLSFRETGSLTYNAAGQVLEQHTELDQATIPGGDIDGVIDSRSSSTFEYDAAGNLVRQVSTSAPTGFPAGTAITVYAYDSRGNVVSLVQEADFNTDGTIDVRVSQVNTYNSRGQLVNSTEQDDFDGNGTIDFIRVTTVLYNGVKP